MNVRDHLANERTFLAWVRTAIALLGFGVLIAKLRFLEIAPHGGYPLDSARPGLRLCGRTDPAAGGLALRPDAAHD